MQALAYWQTVTADRSDFLHRILALLSDERIRYCVIGGQAVNAYVEPVVSLDLDLAVAMDDLARAEVQLRGHFRVERGSSHAGAAAGHPGPLGLADGPD